MKKLKAFLVLALSFVVSAFAWVGCSDPAPAACSHTGGTATCKAKAVCDLCGEEYGELNAENHASAEFTYTANENGTHAKKNACCGAVVDEDEACSGGEATCKDKAVCALCETAYGEVDADKHTSEETKIVSNNDGTHSVVKVCCEEVISTDNCSGGDAKCQTLAICDVCKTAYGDFDKAVHESEEFTYVDNEDGTHSKKMSCCGTVVETAEHVFAEEWTQGEDSHYKLCVCGAKAEEAAHDYKKKAIADEHFEECTVCEKQINNAAHEAGEWKVKDEDKHWKLCECGWQMDEAAHSYVWKVGETQNSYECECGKVALRDGEPFVVTTADNSAYTLHAESTTFDLLAALGGEESEIVYQIGMFELEPLSFTFNGQDVTEAFAGDTENVPVSIFGDARGEQVVEMVLFSGSMGGADYFEHVCEIKFNIVEAGDEGHAVGEVWQSDENNHWKLCECGLAISEAAHSYAWEVGETQNSYQCDCGKVALRDGEPFVVTTADDTAFELSLEITDASKPSEVTFDLLAALGGEESEIVYQIGMFELEPLRFTFNGQDVTEAFAGDTENVPASLFGNVYGEQVVEMVLFSGSMGGADYFEHVCEIKFNLITKTITTPDELVAIARVDSGETKGTVTGYYVLGNDLDFANYGNVANMYNASHTFSGTLDGRNKVVKSITMGGGSIFGVTQDATIKNINFTDVRITKNSYSALLVGQMFQGTKVQNVTAKFSEVNMSTSAVVDAGLMVSRYTGNAAANKASYENVVIDASGLDVISVFGSECRTVATTFTNVTVYAKSIGKLGDSAAGNNKSSVTGSETSTEIHSISGVKVYTVESAGDYYTFAPITETTFKLNATVAGCDDFVVYADGAEITPDADGVYTIASTVTALKVVHGYIESGNPAKVTYAEDGTITLKQVAFGHTSNNAYYAYLSEDYLEYMYAQGYRTLSFTVEVDGSVAAQGCSKFADKSGFECYFVANSDVTTKTVTVTLLEDVPGNLFFWYQNSGGSGNAIKDDTTAWMKISNVEFSK